MTRYDPSAIGSDVPRSRSQYLARTFASWVVQTFGFNRGGALSTEIVQQIRPVCTIATRVGPLRCVGGHGRLRWRASTFYTEEPETIKWLDGLQRDDLLWDIGANVGLYSIYAALVAGCRVLAVEPEAQNYATLLENIVLNGAGDRVEAANLAIARAYGIGRLQVHAMTKGGAYNQFIGNGTAAGGGRGGAVTQVQMGVSLDDLVAQCGFPEPTHLKIDVDGNEPEILSGGRRLLTQGRCRSVLVEIQRGDPEHERAVEALRAAGFRCVSERSNWSSRDHREREAEHPAVNMIFERGGR